MDGYYAIKVTLLGEYWCLLEESEEVFLIDIFGEGESWWKKLFEVVQRWNEEVIDDGKVFWIGI